MEMVEIILHMFLQKKLVTVKFGSYTGNGNADGTFVYQDLNLHFL